VIDALRGEIESILDKRAFAKFVGLREGIIFEAKRAQAYDLSLPEQRYELARDVSALANSQGGWIVLGLATVQNPSEASDEVARLDLLPMAR
jgi:hypothetical protein